MLQLHDPAPRWETLIPDQVPPVRVLFPALPSPKAIRKAQEAVLAVFIGAGHAPDEVKAAADEGDGDAMDIMIDAGEAFSRELVRWSILDWEGVGDKAGTPVRPEHDIVVVDPDTKVRTVTPRTISAALATGEFMAAADRLFVLPWSKRDAEKNASAASPNGISAPAKAADIVDPPAMSKSADAASDAPTEKSMRLKPKRAKASGTY